MVYIYMCVCVCMCATQLIISDCWQILTFKFNPTLTRDALSGSASRGLLETKIEPVILDTMCALIPSCCEARQPGKYFEDTSDLILITEARSGSCVKIIIIQYVSFHDHNICHISISVIYMYIYTRPNFFHPIFIIVTLDFY